MERQEISRECGRMNTERKRDIYTENKHTAERNTGISMAGDGKY